MSIKNINILILLLYPWPNHTSYINLYSILLFYRVWGKWFQNLVKSRWNWNHFICNVNGINYVWNHKYLGFYFPELHKIFGIEFNEQLNSLLNIEFWNGSLYLFIVTYIFLFILRHFNQCEIHIVSSGETEIYKIWLVPYTLRTLKSSIVSRRQLRMKDTLWVEGKAEEGIAKSALVLSEKKNQSSTLEALGIM